MLFSLFSSFFAQALLPHQFKFLLSFPLSFLFAGVSAHMSKPGHKNMLSVVASTFYIIGVFGLWGGVRALIISSMGAYTIAKYIQGPWMPWLGFAFVMGHLSLTHLYPEYAVEGMSINGAHMVLAIKLTSFCWNVHDGRQPEGTLSQRQKEHALQTLPPLLDFAGYVFFFPTLFVGPAFDFAEYQQWLVRHHSTSADQVKLAAKKAVYGVAWRIALLKVTGMYSPWLLLSYQSLHRSVLRRIWHLYVLGFSTRMKYYGFWCMTEGACILSGISYNGIDFHTGRTKWDRMENVRPLKLEFAQAADPYIRSWNVRTHLWLRDYVHLRCAKHTSSFCARVISFVASAFWHGFNPGHYLSFVAAAVFQTIAKESRRRIRPHFLGRNDSSLPRKRYYDLFTWLLTQIAVAYIFLPFVYPDLWISFAVLKRTLIFSA